MCVEGAVVCVCVCGGGGVCLPGECSRATGLSRTACTNSILSLGIVPCVLRTELRNLEMRLLQIYIKIAYKDRYNRYTHTHTHCMYRYTHCMYIQ